MKPTQIKRIGGAKNFIGRQATPALSSRHVDGG
jgi:hypothetical protein